MRSPEIFSCQEKHGNPALMSLLCPVCFCTCVLLLCGKCGSFFKNHFARHSVLQLTRFICFGLTLRTIIQVVTGFEVIVENFGFKVHKMLPKIDLEQHL